MIKTIVDCASGVEQVMEMTAEEMPTQSELNNQAKQNILNQLEQFDNIVPRILEDIIAQGNFTIHQSKLDIITQKQALRQQLQDLEEV